ncbi:LysR substrate-binding domain-containing protein [Sphingomonas sp. H160509]|nr:LysR substrate-binding domain-containing protein [Sphingomonas sp. H160509]MDD1452078.1 LysR substrate-binding domain-containing protein [Sphingomonas sp. H160509]
MRTRLIFRDRFVGAARTGHPLLSGAITPERYAACRHVAASRRGAFTGPVDAALAELGLSRDTMVVVPGFSDALRIARQSDLIALVPGLGFRRKAPGAEGICAFPLPVPTPRDCRVGDLASTDGRRSRSPVAARDRDRHLPKDGAGQLRRVALPKFHPQAAPPTNPPALRRSRCEAG